MASRMVRKAVEPIEDYEDDTEAYEETPTPVKRSSRLNGDPVSSGWGAPTQERRETVKAPYLDMKVPGKRVIKILDEVPSATFRQHYVKSRNSYFTCAEIKEYDDQSRHMEITVHCPLCDAGHYAGQQFRMNVVDMKKPEEVVTWTFGPLVKEILMGLAEDRALNDSGWYFHMWRTKPANGGTWTYTVHPLKARDLGEDHGIEPLSSDELTELEKGRYGVETVWINTQKQLAEAASQLVDIDFKKN